MCDRVAQCIRTPACHIYSHVLMRIAFPPQMRGTDATERGTPGSTCKQSYTYALFLITYQIKHMSYAQIEVVPRLHLTSSTPMCTKVQNKIREHLTKMSIEKSTAISTPLKSPLKTDKTSLAKL